MTTAKPQTISWNLTRLCNLECAHCYLDAGLRKGLRREELHTRQCLEILEQLHAANPEALLILTGGEPLLRSDLDRIVTHATGLGLWVVLGTNGTLLTAARARRLNAAGIKGVGVSIDSLLPEAHDRFRGKAGAWAAAVEGVDAAVAAGIDTVIQVSINHWNVPEIPAFAEFAVAHGARAVNFYFLVCTGRGQRHAELDPETAEGVYRQLYDLQNRYRGRILVNAKCAPQFQRYVYQRDPDSPQLHTFQGGCPAATYYCRIDATGSLTPCPYIPESGGNLADAAFAHIWETSPVFRRLRERTGLQGRCGACEFQSICSGCRARALADLGDLMAEDPLCSYLPDGTRRSPVALPRTALYGDEDEDEGAPGIQWDAAALEGLGRIPPFVRGLVRRRMERMAAERGMTTISHKLLLDMKDKAAARLGKSSPS